MKIDERLSLIKSVGEEIVTEEEVKELLSEKKNFLAYDGFEPSGRVHIAQGILRAINGLPTLCLYSQQKSLR